MRRSILIAALAVVVTTACGDLLGGVGDLSRRVVHGDESDLSTTTTVPSEGPALRLNPITGVDWFNDTLGDTTLGLEGPELLAAVWSRGDGISPFIQASRREVAAALPGIQFPQLVPGSVTHVSSQLVFDTMAAALDPSTAAAIGLWASEPYALPRAEAQLAVLRVGLRGPADFDTGGFVEIQVSEGRELAWADGDYVYQLFCRTGVGEPACIAIAESLFPLQTMLST